MSDCTSPFSDPDIDQEARHKDVLNDAIELNKENRKLRALLKKWIELNGTGYVGSTLLIQRTREALK